MTTDQLKEPSPIDNQAIRRFQHNCWSKGIAILIVINFSLVLFNVTYVPLRHIYLHYTPTVVRLYDPVKGIKDHPVTQSYLNSVQKLTQTLRKSAPDQKPVEKQLRQLRQDSLDLLEDYSFNPTHQTLKALQIMRHHQGVSSARQAFLTFWSPDHFTPQTQQAELAFFQTQVQPLLQTTFMRTVNNTGQYVDYFWQIDLWFVVVFAYDMVWRSLTLSRLQPQLSWGDVILRRWYDGLLLVPVWRVVRLIPAVTRLHQSKLLSLDKLLVQITHEPAAYLAERTSMFMLVRLINQTKTSIQQDGIEQLLTASQPYRHVNGANTSTVLVDRLMQLVIYRVLPQIQPGLEDLLRHSLTRSLQRSDLYRATQVVPGLDQWPDTAIQEMADYLAHTSYEVLAHSYADQEGRYLVDQLAASFRESLHQELQETSTKQDLRKLFSDVLEELKLNYVQRSEDYNPEVVLTEADHLQETISDSSV
ncbi:MAG: hypothetical protein HC921_07990 [Synechococcaceae cyanobacterium SM2_3_1]|nr:hypothetical protein [Synechococcaceae cyanobacterium SM2_3_1]